MKVNEIFYSLQGEGFHTGTPAVFVRLSGCNLRCDFCDTDFRDGRELSEQEVLSELLQYPSRFVVLTGGEPTLQITARFVRLLKDDGYYVALETNGTLPLSPDLLSLIDWITCSPKQKPVRIQRIDELKVVYEGQDMSQYDSLRASHYALQPCDRQDEERNRRNIRACIDYVLQHPRYRLSLQTHKLLNIK